MSKSHENVRKFAQCIEDARAGDANWQRFLRTRLADTSRSMPLDLLLLLSEVSLKYRREELLKETGLD
jgi:hypothetical protein